MSSRRQRSIPLGGRYRQVSLYMCVLLAIHYLTMVTVSDITAQTLQWRHNGRDGVSNNQPHDCLLNRLCRRRSKQTSKLRVTGLWAGNALVKWPVTRKLFPFDDVIMNQPATDGELSKLCSLISPSLFGRLSVLRKYIRFFESHSYLTGATAAQLWRHLSNRILNR